MNARAAWCCSCCLVVTPASAWCCDPDDCFDMAEFVPADVTAYVSVTDGAEIRRELARYPIGDWLKKWTVSPELGRAWDSLAASANVSGAELFDTAFGEAFTLVVRGRGADAEWAFISHVEVDEANRLLRSLRPRLVRYWKKMPVFDLPEHQLLVMRAEDRLLIGPNNGRQSRLFESVCKAVVDDVSHPLEDDEAFESATQLGGGALFVFVRHDDGGIMHREPVQQNFQFASNRHERDHAERERNWTAFRGSLEGRELTIRHASAQPVFNVRGLEHVEAWDMAPLTALGEQNVLALIKPVEDDDGLIDRVVEEKLGGVELRTVVREQKNARHILVVDESDESGASITVAQALELGCDEACIAELESALNGLNVDIGNLDRGAYLVQPAARTQVYVTSRSAEDYAQDEVGAIFRGLPVMQPKPVKWTVAEGPTSNWCIMSNDHGKLQAMAEALAAQPVEEPVLGAWVSCGSGDGRRLADTLRGLAQPAGAGRSATGGAVDQSLSRLTSIAGVVDQFSWTLARTGEGRLMLDVKLKLARLQPSP